MWYEYVKIANCVIVLPVDLRSRTSNKARGTGEGHGVAKTDK